MASNNTSPKSLAIISGTTATYSLLSDHEIDPSMVLDVTALAARPPAQATRPDAWPPGLERGCLASPARSQSAGRLTRGLSPARTIAKKVFQGDLPRPNMGKITPKVVPIRKLFSEDSVKDEGNGEPKSPGSPSYTIRGGPTPNGGWGKVLIPKHRENVLRGDASIDESIDSTPLGGP